MVPMQYSGFAKKSKEKKLKREIQALKRQLKLERKISGQSEIFLFINAYNNYTCTLTVCMLTPLQNVHV